LRRSPRVHTFIATSPIHMEKKLRMEPSQVIEQAVRAVKWAREYTDNVEFSPEDAGRSDIDFLCRILEQVIKAGATTINMPDTVGYTLPEQFGRLIRTLRERMPNSDKVVWSVHCHNDLGLAVANSLAAVMNGARQVECTVNGLGERAGNASLEEIVMAVRTRQDVFPCDTRIDATQIVPASKLVSAITGFRCSPTRRSSAPTRSRTNRASTRTACSSTARPTKSCVRGRGLDHQQARAGQALRPQRVQDAAAGTRHRARIGGSAERRVQAFKEIADKKHEIFDEDLQALITEEEIEHLERALSPGVADRAFRDR
jgi:2-isopropylmalate synthase